jgi:hypothetical protein
LNQVGLKGVVRISTHLYGVVLEDHGIAVAVRLDFEICSHDERKISDKSLLFLLVKLILRNSQNDVETSGNDLVSLGRRFAVETVPAAGGVVAALLTLAVAVVIAAEGVVVFVAGKSSRFAIVSVKQTFFSVAGLVTETVLENVPTVFAAASCRVAKLPRVQAESTVAAVVVADVSVALFVASVVALLFVAAIVDALLKLFLVVDNLVEAVGQVYSSGRSLVRNFAVLSSPFGLARTIVVADSVNAMSVLAGIVGALISGVLLAGFASCSGRAEALKVRALIDAGAAIETGLVFTAAAQELAVQAAVAGGAGAHVAVFARGAYAAILTGAVLTEVSLCLTVSSHEAVFANAVVVVDQLDALLGAAGRAGVGQALVDISFTSGSDKAWSTFAFVASDFVNTGSSVMAGSFETLVNIDLTEYSKGSVRTRAPEVIHQIVTGSTVLTGVSFTVVDVEFAVAPLVAFGTGALVGANQIFAGGAVLTGIGQAFVDLTLAVAAVIPVSADALVAAAGVSAESSVLTKSVRRHMLHSGGAFARHATNVTDLAGPVLQTVTVEGGSSLRTPSSIFAGRVAAPVDDLFALVAGPAGRAVALIKPVVVDAAATISAGFLVAGGDVGLAVGACEARRADAGVVVDAVDAGALVQAGGRSAVLVVGLAVVAGKAASALTPEKKTKKKT